jgi:hypothetical protein
LRRAEESLAALPQAQFAGYAAAAKDWLKIISERAQTIRYQVADQVTQTQ